LTLLNRHRHLRRVLDCTGRARDRLPRNSSELGCLLLVPLALAPPPHAASEAAKNKEESSEQQCTTPPFLMPQPVRLTQITAE
jgi:hypothetical protein